MSRSRLRSLIAVLLIAAAAALSACGGSDDAETTAAGSTTTDAAPPAATTGSETSGAAEGQGGKPARRGQGAKQAHGPLAAPLDAIALAERKAGGDAYDIESERLGGDRVWEIKVARGSGAPLELDVSADGSRVIRQRERSSADDDASKVAGAKVSLGEALKAAAGEARGATLDEAEIDRWRGGLVWEASFDTSGGGEIEVKVDARSGKVVDTETDD